MDDLQVACVFVEGTWLTSGWRSASSVRSSAELPDACSLLPSIEER